METEKSGCFFILLTIAMIFIFLTPFAFLWSLNTLFSFHLDYSFKNVVAAIILCGLFGSRSYSKKGS